MKAGCTPPALPGVSPVAALSTHLTVAERAPLALCGLYHCAYQVRFPACFLEGEGGKLVDGMGVNVVVALARLLLPLLVLPAFLLPPCLLPPPAPPRPPLSPPPVPPQLPPSFITYLQVLRSFRCMPWW